MKFLDDFYICCGCHRTCSREREMHLLEEAGLRAFCSEACLEKFYKDLMVRFSLHEKRLRETLKVPVEPCCSLGSDQPLLQEVLSQPDETHSIDNGVGDTVTILFAWKQHPLHGGVGVVVYCLKDKERPYLILHAAFSQEQKLLDQLLPPKEQEGEEGKLGPSDVFVDQETLNALEGKKSQLMATLLELRSPMDIPFEEFANYDPFLGQTLEKADEVFSEVDVEGDEVFKFFKACNQSGQNFYYVVVGIILGVDEDNMTETIVPIIAFPTIDGELYRAFRTGQQVSGPLKS